MKKVARTLKKYFDNILTYFDCYITNAFSEGINSKIQALKANARGFRNFQNYQKHGKKWVVSIGSVGIVLIVIGAILPYLELGERSPKSLKPEGATALPSASQSDVQGEAPPFG